jgi:intergrase/recombinase
MDRVGFEPTTSAATLFLTTQLGLQSGKRASKWTMRFCRKVFASHLRQSGIEGEIVDLLQGCIPKRVFARHYFTPSLEYRGKVIHALTKLKKEI